MSVMPEQKPGRSKQDYATPPDFIAAVKVKLGIAQFDFDFAADDSNHKAPCWWSTATDALAQDATAWAARLPAGWHWGWLNPEFAQIAPWAEYCSQVRRLDRSIAFLVPAGVGANWFRDHVDGQARVLLLNGRIEFDPLRPGWGYPKDCMLCLFSPFVDPGYEVWTWPADVPASVDRVAPLIFAYLHGDVDSHRLVGIKLRGLNSAEKARYYEGIRPR